MNDDYRTDFTYIPTATGSISTSQFQSINITSPNRPLVIGLTGAAGSGKDTLADYWVKNHGFIRFAFADALRAAVLTLDPMLPVERNKNGNIRYEYDRLSNVVDELGWDRAKRENPEVRRLLQVMGTEVGRQILGENCWVNIVSQQMHKLEYDAATPRSSKPLRFVITDCRFENEAEFIRTVKHGVVIRLERPDNPDAIASTHSSEKLAFEPDAVIKNDGDLAKLHRKAENALKWALKETITL